MKKGLYILLFMMLIVVSGGCSSEQKLKKEYEALIEETEDDLLPVLDMENGERKKEYDPKLLSDDTGAYSKELWTISGGQIDTPGLSDPGRL